VPIGNKLVNVSRKSILIADYVKPTLVKKIALIIIPNFKFTLFAYASNGAATGMTMHCLGDNQNGLDVSEYTN